MSNQLEKSNKQKEQMQVAINGQADAGPAIRSFMSSVNTLPTDKDVRINKLANNSKYLSIGYIENQLDHHFQGLWRTKNFKYTVVANEIIGDLELEFFHPAARVWLSRAGVAAVMIQQKKDSEITDIGSKIKNTLVKDIGHLKAECIKNAAKSIGDNFGRSLNRDIEDGMLQNVDQVDDILIQLYQCESEQELIQLFQKLPQTYKNDRRVKAEFSKKKVELKTKES